MAKRLSPAVIYVLKGLIPYTRQNLLLSFKPNRFFYELEKISGYSKPTLQQAYYRAKKSNLISSSSIPRLTKLGENKLRPFTVQKLKNGGQLMVIFDIPESMTLIRRQFRYILRILHFNPVQQSVWITKYDQRSAVSETVKELGLEDYVQLYEAARIPTIGK